MNSTTRQKYMDALNRRADLIAQADSAFAENNIEKGKDLTAQAAALNPEIEGYQALLEQEGKFAGAKAPAMDPDAKDRAEERAETLRNGGRITFSIEEVIDGLGLGGRVKNSVTLATGTLLEPTRLATSIRDNLPGVSSILDQVSVQDLTGTNGILEPLLYSEPEAQAGKIATLAGTARTAISDPTFGAVKISPYEVNVTTFVDRNLSKLTPIAYEEKIRSLAMKAMRRKIANMIYNGDGQAAPDMFGIKTAKDTAGRAMCEAVNITQIKAGFLDDFVFAYGTDEEMGGSARLYLNKKDLQAIGALRNDELKRVYEIVQDPGNANTGRIIEGGLIVPYTIGSALTALTGATASASADTIHMIYGDPINYELGLFGGYSIRIDESVKAVERMNTILGDVFVGGNVVQPEGFLLGTLPKSGG